MGLKETLGEITEQKKNRFGCAYMSMYNKLKPADQKALDEAWAKGYSSNEILMALRQEGISSSNEAIRRHKLGACLCPKK